MPSGFWSDQEKVKSHSDSVNEAARKGRADSRDIGTPPPPVDPARKDACRSDFRLFCESYFPSVFAIEWSQDHLTAINRIENAVLRGELFALAMPRGSGKTTLCEISALWATMYGHHSFVLLVGASVENATSSLHTLKGEIEENDLLNEDFGEVTHPVRSMEGSIRRADLQHIGGELTKIGWRTDEMVFPTVAGSPCSGATLKVRGLTGSIRGLKTRMPDGTTSRPSLVIIDDPQTDDSAKSPSQCHQRERILSGAILNLAGPGKSIAGIMPCTVIRSGDMADSILDRKQHPDWQGDRFKLVYEWPENTELWNQYLDIRREEFEADGDGTKSTEFYRSNREAMDIGSRVAWDQRFTPRELSAIQHAYNLRSRDESAFYSEYQNEPLADDEKIDNKLTAAAVSKTISGLDRLEIPSDCQHVVSYVDVQKSVLYYSIVAWEPGGTGHVIDYGTWPQQKVRYFSLNKINPTIQMAHPGISLEGQLFSALESIDRKLTSLNLVRDDGAEMRIERRLVDANWGESTDAVYKFARHCKNDWLPCHGRGYGAIATPMNELKRKPGEKIGYYWRIPGVTGKRVVRHLNYDVNFWKTYLVNRLQTPLGARGSLTFFNDSPSNHRLVADHILAEYSTSVTAKGRTIEEWRLRPEKPDNHWLDCIVGCCAAGSLCGVSLDDEKKPKRRRVTYI